MSIVKPHALVIKSRNEMLMENENDTILSVKCSMSSSKNYRIYGFIEITYNLLEQKIEIQQIKMKENNPFHIRNIYNSENNSKFIANGILTEFYNYEFHQNITFIFEIETIWNRQILSFKINLICIWKSVDLLQTVYNESCHNIEIETIHVLKYVFRSIVFDEYNIYVPSDILCVIFESYLSKYRVIYGEPFIYDSPKLNVNNVKKICHSLRCKLGYFDEYEIGKSYFVHKKYPKQIQNCYVNGIVIEIETKCTHSEFLKILNKFGNSAAGLVWTPFNNKTLFKLEQFIDEIKEFMEAFKKYDAIAMNVRLLMDEDVSNEDMSMLWIEWEKRSKYKNIKEEVMQNSMFQISAYDWNETLRKCRVFRRNWMKRKKSNKLIYSQRLMDIISHLQINEKRERNNIDKYLPKSTKCTKYLMNKKYEKKHFQNRSTKKKRKQMYHRW